MLFVYWQNVYHIKLYRVQAGSKINKRATTSNFHFHIQSRGIWCFLFYGILRVLEDWLFEINRQFEHCRFDYKFIRLLWLFFFSFRKMFSDNTRVIIFFFFCSSKHEIFFQNLTLGYMTKIPNQIIFFPPPKSESFFQQHWESEYFFLAKNHNPPPPFQVKLSFPYEKIIYVISITLY